MSLKLSLLNMRKETPFHRGTRAGPRDGTLCVWPRSRGQARRSGGPHGADRPLPGRGSFQKHQQGQAAGFGCKPIPDRTLSRNPTGFQRKARVLIRWNQLGHKSSQEAPLDLPHGPAQSSGSTEGLHNHTQRKAPGPGSKHRTPDCTHRTLGQGPGYRLWEGAGEGWGAAALFWGSGGSGPQGQRADKEPELTTPSHEGMGVHTSVSTRLLWSWC